MYVRDERLGNNLRQGRQKSFLSMQEDAQLHVLFPHPLQGRSTRHKRELHEQNFSCHRADQVSNGDSYPNHPRHIPRQE